MPLPQGSLCMCQQDRTMIFRAEGFARAAQGLALRRMAEQGLAAGASNLWVDLQNCTHMDSTFLGTMLHLQRAVRRQGYGGFALVTPSPLCESLLHQMGMDDVFPTLTAAEAEEGVEGWKELCCDVEMGEGFKNKVIQAHQELAELPGKAGEPFRQMVQGLTQDAETKKMK